MKRIIAFAALTALICALFAFGASAETQYATVVTPTSDGKVYVRTVAGAGRPIAGVANNGDQLIILKRGNTWHRVQVVRTGLTGYMYGEYIRFQSSAPSSGAWGADTSWNSGGAQSGYAQDASIKDTDTVINRFGTINSSDGFANLRWGPDTNKFGVISKIYNNTIVWALEQNGNWYRCATQSGQIGYIYKTLVKLGETSTGAIGHRAVTRSSDGSANVREGAGTSRRVVVSLPVGAGVNVLDFSGGWYRVSVSGSGATGYIHRSLLRFMSRGVTSGDVNLRSGPATSYSKLRVLASGTRVTLLATDNNFCRVDTGSETGYMSKKYLTF